jgi:hypothetical protein
MLLTIDYSNTPVVVWIAIPCSESSHQPLLGPVIQERTRKGVRISRIKARFESERLNDASAACPTWSESPANYRVDVDLCCASSAADRFLDVSHVSPAKVRLQENQA